MDKIIKEKDQIEAVNFIEESIKLIKKVLKKDYDIDAIFHYNLGSKETIFNKKLEEIKPIIIDILYEYFELNKENEDILTSFRTASFKARQILIFCLLDLKLKNVSDKTRPSIDKIRVYYLNRKYTRQNILRNNNNLIENIKSKDYTTISVLNKIREEVKKEGFYFNNEDLGIALLDFYIDNNKTIGNGYK